MYQLVRSIIHDLASDRSGDLDGSIGGLSLVSAREAATILAQEYQSSGWVMSFGETTGQTPVAFYGTHPSGECSVYIEVQRMRPLTDAQQVIRALESATHPSIAASMVEPTSDMPRECSE